MESSRPVSIKMERLDFILHRRKRRRRPRLTNDAIDAISARRKFSKLFILFQAMISLFSVQWPQISLAHQVELQITDSPSAFFDEPQPLVDYLHDSGSGLGYLPASQPASQFNYDTSTVSPSLITAKCWNNYADDNNCKQLNVITAPNGDQQRQQQQQHQQQQDNQLEDNSIITPVVIFESASTVEPPRNPFNNYYQPPYFSSTARPDASNVVLARHRTPPTANDIHAAPPAGATLMPSDFRDNNIGYTTSDYRWQPTTTPSPVPMVTRPSVYVATPQPSKTTTTGRTCRDENDDDCDEPTEDSAKGDADETDDGEADNNYKSTGSPSSSSSSSASYDGVESGSGEGPVNGDDNEEDDDDGEGEGDDGAAGDSLEGSGGAETLASRQPETTTTTLGRHVEITSFVPTVASFYEQTTITAPPPIRTTSRKPDANIEIVVHPTLPASFPISSNQETTSPAPPTTTTGDTVTSRPIYPSTSQPADKTVDLSSTDEETPPVTVDPNPSIILLPMGVKPERNLSQTPSGSGGGRATDDKLNPLNRFVPNSTPKPYVPFGNPWTHTRTPQPPLNIYTAEPVTTMSNKIPKGDPIQKSQPEILSTLLLWSSILILVTTAFIFVCLSIGFWRRNSARQRALLQKANLLNNGQGGGGGHLLANMQQPGLLTTYSPLNQGMNLGKVTTSVIKPPDILPLEEDDEQESKDGLMGDGSLNGNENNNNVNIVSSTEDQQTTSSGSQRTNDSLHRVGNHRPSQYPNSLSDGRQNSSSISDSQGSPDGNGPYPMQNNQQKLQYNNGYTMQQQQQQQQQAPQPPNQNGQSAAYHQNQMQPQIERGFVASRSVEDLQRGAPPATPMNMMRPQLPPGHMQQPMNGFGGQHVQLPNQMMPPPPLVRLPYGPAPPAWQVAMNPLATMSRRYPPGAGLNRNIYSEDSSSFMTTSPSLARTSSSSSFAFANSAKSSLLNYNMGASGQPAPLPPPPVMGRQDRSEAWYL